MSDPQSSTELVPPSVQSTVTAVNRPRRRARMMRGPIRVWNSFRHRWSASLQLRTAVISGVLTLAASVILAIFLTHQITTGLYQSRFNQVEAEANHGLNQARQVFENAATSDQEATSTLVTDTLNALASNTGGSIARDFVLVPLDEDDNLHVGTMNSSGVTEDIISDELAEQVRNGTGVYYQSVGLNTGGSQDTPGMAFGTQVILPPGNYYGLYFIYDLSEVQQTLDYLMNVLLIAGAILILLNVGIAIVMTRSVTRPVKLAAQTAESLSSGNLSVRMDVKRTDEVARLSESFNKMADNIQDHITQLANLSQIQQRFVSDVSHELRTPLTTVRMAAEVLFDSRDEFDPINRRSTELLYHQVERFQALLSDLLEISRFDAGAAEVSAESTDLLHLAADVLLTAQPLADNAKIELFIVPMGEEFTAEVDSRRIERILRNLVNNAIEHGEGQPVDVVVRASRTEIAIVVRDHGMGMTPEQVAHVFDRFWRADPARARTTGGSGLGLAIAVEDTHLHNGQIDVWGEIGKGAAFRLVLPRVSGGTITPPPPLDLPPEYDYADRRTAKNVDIIPDEHAPRLIDRTNEQSLHPQRAGGSEAL